MKFDKFTTGKEYNIEFKGLFGINEYLELGWGYVMPRLPKDLYFCIKKHLGNKETCFPSEDYLMFLSGIKKKEDLEASIQFLQLLGFIFCKHGNYKRNITNIYCINRLYTLKILENKGFIQEILNILKKRNFNRKSRKDKEMYAKSFEYIEEYIENIDKTSKLTFESTAGRWDFIDNKRILNTRNALLQKIYSIIKLTVYEDYDYYNSLWDNNNFLDSYSFRGNQKTSEEYNNPQKEEETFGEQRNSLG
ncbi:hypothetical protein [Tepidibacter formicigenes]|jgi:hypothetical protein|uniref:Uncharacterized protein n=1 Tax=Tepidibacter formicigenes DSM 15518 TaxID=1123349 RepID=A0A1M6QPG9_9FIRM|nr:hypothetical protein [Tepidibacter formicigenes]SHK22106.1 hypothetical protein SAMN02744037_01907 [Tepidibacter formicigenes DSM 15518]